ncbi:MAG: hypothetical protein UR21_C0013G0022 [Candidatus Woesebacteria bacterium GW2011_GWC2_31_9]|uniref:Transcriptional regulator n=1 Tax=Candidatus Woesebacteria bacterium GW2011_GWC2_31_9 TaxID=1618586 RepID=A0A0F9YIP5_9BACT|nr:MAG: hypothetical protein UR21_C0013G0022 [Candidatus Woesebacteria bacterium GW2011_GWC2_31_9]
MNKLIPLLKSKQVLFHTQDIALLWGIKNRQTLRMTISRYVKKGILKSVTRGLYSTISVEDLNKYQLGASLIHRFSYLSCESILEQNGVINQKIYTLTYVSSISQKRELYLYLGR